MALSSAVQGRREQEVRPGRVGWASKQRQHVHVCQTSGPGGDKRRCDKRGQRAGPRFTEVSPPVCDADPFLDNVRLEGWCNKDGAIRSNARACIGGETGGILAGRTVGRTWRWMTPQAAAAHKPRTDQNDGFMLPPSISG